MFQAHSKSALRKTCDLSIDNVHCWFIFHIMILLVTGSEGQSTKHIVGKWKLRDIQECAYKCVCI